MWRDWIIRDWIGNIGWSWRHPAVPKTCEWTETEAEMERRNAIFAAKHALLEAYKNGESVNIYELRKLRLETDIRAWMYIEEERLKRTRDRKMAWLVYRGALRIRAKQERSEKQRPIVRENR